MSTTRCKSSASGWGLDLGARVVLYFGEPAVGRPNFGPMADRMVQPPASVKVQREPSRHTHTHTHTRKKKENNFFFAFHCPHPH